MPFYWIDNPSNEMDDGMTKRRYRRDRRAELQAETRERIIRATVELHARHGGLGTTFAMIAEKAEVSPQTVYNHFADRGALFGACTGHVNRMAPPLDLQRLREGASAEDRLRRLAEAVYARHDFMAPWLKLGWHEAALIPELGAVFAQGEAELRALVAALVQPEREPDPFFLDFALVLLGYPAWEALTRRRSGADAAEAAGDTLADLLHRFTTRKD